MSQVARTLSRFTEMCHRPTPMSEKARTDNTAPATERHGEVPPWWSFRISTGITARVLFPMLWRHRFRVSLSRLPIAIIVSLASLVTMLPAWSQRRRFGAKIAATPLPPPVFIVGHWRSGTTYLHELLATDASFITPTYLHTFSADYSVRLGRFIRRLSVFLPARRPMDDVAAGWDRPQEDEFGLLATGAPSPYEVILFPNDRSGVFPNLDVEAMAPADQQRWREAFIKVMKQVAFAAGDGDSDAQRRMLLKSPTHTARIGTLHRMFPDARFIHVTRDPFALFASSEHLWRRMFLTQGLQKPRYDGDLALPAFINTTMRALYRDFDRDVGALPDGHFAETRFEDLARDPAGEVARLRHELGLAEADATALQKYLDDVRGHRRNRFLIDDDTTQTVRQEWEWYFQRFGYDPEGGAN